MQMPEGMPGAKAFNMMKLQEQIKNNHSDVSSYLNDMVDWSKKMNVKDKTVPTETPKQSNAKLPPIRNKIDI
jgi:hypothetical protein